MFGLAWWRYPPPPFPTARELPKIDLLLLSHIHPDHSGPGTLRQLGTGIPTAFHPFPSKRLVRRVERCGYTNVKHMKGWDTQEMLPGVKITFVPHDRGWEVASIVVEHDDLRLYHGNDNTLSVEGYEEIVKRLGPIDIAFLPFAGASSYPTGFDWDRETLAKQGEAKKAGGVARLTDGIKGLQPKVAVPFASSWALLEESELWKNYLDRPTAKEASKAADNVLVLEPGDEWSPEGVVRNDRTKGWACDAASVRRYAAQMKDKVEAAVAKRDAAIGADPDPAKLEQAFRAYFSEMLERTKESTRKLKMRAGFRCDGAVERSWHVIFEPGKDPDLRDGPGETLDEIITLAASELWAIFTTEANWEDPWYGYRMRVHKREGAGYYRAFWEMLLNFDDEDLSSRIQAQ